MLQLKFGGTHGTDRVSYYLTYEMGQLYLLRVSFNFPPFFNFTIIPFSIRLALLGRSLPNRLLPGREWSRFRIDFPLQGRLFRELFLSFGNIELLVLCCDWRESVTETENPRMSIIIRYRASLDLMKIEIPSTK